VSSDAITITPAKRATYKPTKSEMAAVHNGQAAIARGESVSLNDFLHCLDRNRRKARTETDSKVSR